MIRYVDAFRDHFGVEAICRTLGATQCGFLTARGYRAAKTRPVSARAMSDQLLGGEMLRLHADNYGVYGVRRMHALMRRQGWALGRDQTGRIMRSLGIRGVKRSKQLFTTKADPAGMKPLDLVNRRFTATDVFARKIVGFNVAATLRADILPLQALDMAAFTAGGDLTGLTHHSDHGSTYMSRVYTGRIIELGATPSTGTVGDSYDNALAEAINALYKTELIRQRGPWRTVEQVELATLEWVWWWNNQRLHGELDMRTPAEVEAAYCADLESSETATAALEKH